MQNLLIEYCSPYNHSDTITLSFELRNHSVVDKWINRVQLAQARYNIDDPGRFYGFGSVEEQTADALYRIQQSINTINKHSHIIDRQLTDINDQDTLNYLHHIFEIYHGLLDQQHTEYWLNAPIEVRSALANLNILVHRCETVHRGAQPRHVVTWYGLPKTEVLDLDEYQLFEGNTTSGTVYLNYVEIGKTLEDLALDNDQYIGEDAFQPFRHYSADFNVKFYDRQPLVDDVKLKEYYNKHSEFFIKKDLPWGHPYLSSGSIPLADLKDPADVAKLSTRQWVKSITLI